MKVRVADDDLKAAAGEISKLKKNVNWIGKKVGVCETVKKVVTMGLFTCHGAWKFGFLFGISDESA